MSELQTRKNIEQALKGFQHGALLINANNLLKALGYESEITVELESSLAEEFISYFDQFGQLNRERAMVDEWESIDFLFQLTEEEISGTGETRIAFRNRQFDDTIMESYVFFAVKLKESHYTRTQLSTITREINKPMPMPAMIIFQHGQTLSLAVIDRRLNKQDASKDVLKKVTLIKDINSHDPHAAHIQILFDLSRNELLRVHGFSNFVELHRAWAKTLDIQELNKRFYRELSNWYFWAVDNVTFPEDAGENVEIRNATSVIRLITRLIFVWFIKEKKLVPDIFFNPREIEEILMSTDPQESTYYKAILQNLFFATLNQEMNTPEKHPPDKGGRGVPRKFRGKGRQHYNITSLYRYEEYFANSGETLRHFETIPFLNGGLFECLDKEDKDDPKKILRIDGFSDRADNRLSVPNFLFFSEEMEVDLNKVYDTKGKRYKVRGLIEILRRYKFTITENTPIEEEVALDPELLGKVFENLLAVYNPETGATARKQTGSFYTPREIVNYMVDESLIAHLKNTVSSRAIHCPSETKLRHLLAYNDEPHQFTDAETEQLINAIDTLKILDPACGSGAFPMGILHKLVFILAKLDPRNDQWRQRQIAKVQNLIDMAEEIDDSTVRRNTIRDLEQEKDNINEAFTRNELDYGRKLYLIENCIYGVDIQPVAVQIAKLRFFISLVVDQRIDDTQENRGVRPLPNLETKFVSGNTLIGVEKPAQLLMRNPEIDRKETELGGVRRKHFTARTPRTKEKYRDLDKQIRAEISQLLKSDGFPSETTEKIANWDPYDQNAVADFFDAEWMFGITEGFDVVIGNPPYVDSETMTKTQPELRQTYKTTYQSAKGNWDLFIVFIERGIQFQKEDGIISYIVPNKLIGATYAKTLRNMLMNYSVLEIRDYSKVDVFKESDVYPIVFVIRKTDQNDEKNGVSMVVMANLKESSIHNQVPFELFYQDVFWDRFFVSENQLQVVVKCLSFPALESFFEVGAAATVSEAYALKKSIREYSTGLSTIPFKKLINTGTIDRYESLWSKQSTRYIKDSYNTPIVLDSDLRKLSKRRFMQAQSKKIIIGGMTKILECVYDEGEYVAGKSTTIILESGDMNLKYALAILNSRLVSFWYRTYFRSLALAGGYLRIGNNEIKTIPIPDVPSEQQAPIIERVDQILAAKAADSNVDTTALEKEIDKRVYALYNLTEGEIGIVEASQ